MNIAPFSPVKFRINVFYCKLWTPRTTLAVVWADNVHPKSCDETKIDSHAHVERDWFLATLPCILCISTHTLTWSVTLPFFWKLSAEVNFNSHAHVERDFDLKCSLMLSGIFQLTRSRGAWLSSNETWVYKCIFQLTRSRGAWRGHFYDCTAYFVFQLTRSRGAWQRRHFKPLYWFYFNSHAHVERDHI